MVKNLYRVYLNVAKEISSYGPEHRIQTLLQILKKNISNRNAERIRVDLSRQQIADMTGLRVETVIRCMKKMQEKGIINIEKRKVYF